MRIGGLNQSQANMARSHERVKRQEQQVNLAATQAALPFKYADAFQKALDKTKS